MMHIYFAHREREREEEMSNLFFNLNCSSCITWTRGIDNHLFANNSTHYLTNEVERRRAHYELVNECKCVKAFYVTCNAFDVTRGAQSFLSVLPINVCYVDMFYSIILFLFFLPFSPDNCHSRSLAHFIVIVSRIDPAYRAHDLPDAINRWTWRTWKKKIRKDQQDSVETSSV